MNLVEIKRKEKIQSVTTFFFLSALGSWAALLSFKDLRIRNMGNHGCSVPHANPPGESEDTPGN